MFHISVPIIHYSCHITEAEGEVRIQLNRFKPPSIFILTVPRRYFCCGSLLLHDLDRKSLTRFYMTYIRPILEYASIIWDNCTKTQSDLLESINLEAARIITGLRRGTSHAVLYRELGWTSLAERRSNSKLIQLYKILNDDTPTYLSDILFRYNQYDPGYERRNRNTDLKHPPPRKASFQNSFFISTIDLWNNLNDDIKNICTSLYSFKTALTKHITPPPSYFIHGERKYNIIMCQLRNRKISLNEDLFNDHLSDNSFCLHCGIDETVEHYLLHCSHYDNYKMELINSLQCDSIIYSKINICTIDLLTGNSELTYEQNCKLFDIVNSIYKTHKKI